MYCGDETGAFIGDVGSHTSRFGYGGEDHPKYVVPSYVAAGETSSQVVHVPTSCYRERSNLRPLLRMAQVDNNTQQQQQQQQPQVDPNAYLQQGDIIQDWDAYQHVWETSFDVLRVRDTLKHTTGGGNLSSSTTQSLQLNTSPEGVASSTIRSNMYGEGKILHPLLAVDPGCSHICNSFEEAVHRQQRTKLTELFMETFDASSMFVAPSPMLAAFSMGRQTCLLLDVGAGGCRATPVVDGLLLGNAQRRNGRGGDWLGNVQWQALLNQHIAFKPRYMLRRSSNQQDCSSNSSYRGLFYRWAMQDAMYELRTSEHVSLPKYRADDTTTPFVHSTTTTTTQDSDYHDVATTTNKTAATSPPESSYQLPDGTTIDLTTPTGRDLCRVPELLFSDDLPFADDAHKTSSVSSSLQHPTLLDAPLHKLVHAALSAVGDADARKELCGNVVLTGGGSLLPNLEERLSYELSNTIVSTKCRVLASPNSVERAYAPWIGASVLTSLGSFQQLWLSRTEYEEYGATLAIQRFPK